METPENRKSESDLPFVWFFADVICGRSCAIDSYFDTSLFCHVPFYMSISTNVS